MRISSAAVRAARALALFAAILLIPAHAVRADAAPPDPIEGTKWLGIVTSSTASAPFGLEFRRSPRGVLYALSYSPVMHLFTQPASTVQVHDGDYFLDTLNLHLKLEGRTLTGTGLYDAMKFELERVEQLPPADDQSPPANLPSGPSPRWTRSLGAAVWASPVVRDGVVYVGAADGRFHAIAADDGHELWTWSGATPIYGDALVTGDAVYVIDDRCELLRLDRRNGTLVWRVALDPARASAEAIPEDDTYSHRTAVPLLDHGTLYAGSTDGAMFAIDPKSGATRWRFDAKSKIAAAAAVAGDRLIFGTMSGAVIALNRKDGAESWRHPLPAAVTSQPVVDGALAIAGSRDYLLHAFRITDGREVWRQHFWMSWVESRPRIESGVLYVGSSDLRAVRAMNAKTGAPLWSTDVYGSAWGSPLVAGGLVLMGVTGVKPYAIDHRPSIVALDRTTGTIRWRRASAIPQPVGTSGYPGSLAMADGLVIAAGTDGVILALPLSGGGSGGGEGMVEVVEARDPSAPRLAR